MLDAEMMRPSVVSPDYACIRLDSSGASCNPPDRPDLHACVHTQKPSRSEADCADCGFRNRALPTQVTHCEAMEATHGACSVWLAQSAFSGVDDDESTHLNVDPRVEIGWCVQFEDDCTEYAGDAVAVGCERWL